MKSFIASGASSSEFIFSPSAWCLNSVKFQRLIFVLSGFGSSRLFASSSALIRYSFFLDGSLFFSEFYVIYFSSYGNFVNVVITLSLLTSCFTIMLQLFRLQYLILLYPIRNLHFLDSLLVLRHRI